jgi:two-component system CheB/CheR fusion protein
MKRKRPTKQTKTGTKKKLSTKSNELGKHSPRSVSKKSIERKDKKPVSVKGFPIVAIGASAGGIEAISKLLENLSPKLGMAYVIIQHLAPDHESILPELLERKNKHACSPG